MRLASGRVASDDPLVLFLYVLARDKMTVGQIESELDYIASVDGKTHLFCNGWLAEWAKDAAARLRSCDCDCDCDSQDEDDEDEDYDAEDEE